MLYRLFLVSVTVLSAAVASNASAGCSGGTCHLNASTTYSAPVQYSTPVHYNTSTVQSFPTSTYSHESVAYQGDVTSNSVVSSPVNYSVAKPVVSSYSAPVVSTPSAYTMPSQTYQPQPYCPSCQLRNQ